MLSADSASLKKLNQLVWRIFTKSFGLTLQADAATFLADKITSYSMSEAQMNDFLTYMAQNYAKISKDRSGMVTKANIELVFTQVYQSQDYQNSKGKVGDVRKYVKMIDALNTPKFEFDFHSKTFVRVESQGALGTPLDKISVAVRRFNLVKQRLLKQIRGGTLFPGSSNLVISPIKSIKGISAPGTIRYVLGTVSEMVEGSYSLEDPEDFIALDFSQLKQTPQDFIVEGSIILVKAVCLANRLQVESILVPPAEARIETMSMLSHPDIMEATNFAQPAHELQILEKQAKRSRFVVLSDVWLDQPSILNRLQVLFDGFNAQGFLPEVFIMIGPFTSTPPKDGPRAWSHYQDLFDNFAVFIERIKNARNVRFVFVPAGNDPGFMESLTPRPPMPDVIFDSWRRANLDFVAASNPCRLVYFTQEIVIYRQELTNLLRKNDLKLEAVRNPDESGLEEDLELTQISQDTQKTKPSAIPDEQRTCKTLLDQASLSPFCLSTKTQMWNYDHAMTMYPIPDALIVAERQGSYTFNYEGCACSNPGSFPSAEGSFLMYNPSQKTFELCEIPK